jgi:hypothetical protein
MSIETGFHYHPNQNVRQAVFGVTSRNGKNRTLRRSKNYAAKIKRSRTRLQLVLCDDWHGNTGCLAARDLALLTKVRTFIHEEISLLTVLYFPFRERTPTTAVRNRVTSNVDQMRVNDLLRTGTAGVLTTGAGIAVPRNTFYGK